MATAPVALEMRSVLGVWMPITCGGKGRVRFRSEKEGGIVWEYNAYRNLSDAARATGLSVATLRWKLEHR